MQKYNAYVGVKTIQGLVEEEWSIAVNVPFAVAMNHIAAEREAMTRGTQKFFTVTDSEEWSVPYLAEGKWWVTYLAMRKA